MTFKERQILVALINLLNELAYEQAYREFSGKNWYEEFSKKIEELKRMDLP